MHASTERRSCCSAEMFFAGAPSCVRCDLDQGILPRPNVFMRAISCSFLFFLSLRSKTARLLFLVKANQLLLQRARRVFGLALVDHLSRRAQTCERKSKVDSGAQPPSAALLSRLRVLRPAINSPGNERRGYELHPLRTRTAGIEPATSCLRKRSTAEVTRVFATDESSFLSLRSKPRRGDRTTSSSCACSKR